MEASAAIRRLFEEGEREWPDVKLASDVFEAFLAERVGDTHGADLYLACACAHEDPRALEAFEARYMSQVPKFLAGVERSRVVIDEICQLVRERLFVAGEGREKKIREYSGRGSLTSWLRVVCLRVASNRRRGDRPHASFDEQMSATELLPAVDPELAIIRTRYRGAFDDALRKAFESLTPRERLLFRMHFLDGLNIERMGVVFGVHRATVARWLASAREGVLERTMSLLGNELRLDVGELESLLRVVRSGLDVSLRGLLTAPHRSRGGA